MRGKLRAIVDGGALKPGFRRGVCGLRTRSAFGLDPSEVIRACLAPITEGYRGLGRSSAHQLSRPADGRQNLGALLRPEPGGRL
jgi:hypothetical protein